MPRKWVMLRHHGKHYHRGTECGLVDPDYFEVPEWLARKAGYIPCPSCYNPSKIKFKGDV